MVEVSMYRKVLSGTAGTVRAEATPWNSYARHQLPEMSPSKQKALEGAESLGLIYRPSRIARMDATVATTRLKA